MEPNHPINKSVQINRAMKKESLNDELSEISPWLRDMKRQDDGFRVPDDYFESLEARVFARIEEEGARREPVMEATRGGKWFRPKMMLAAAALFVAILAAVWLLRPQPEVIVASTELSDEDVEAYVLANAYEFEPEQLASLQPDTPSELPDTPDSSTETPGKSAAPGDDISPEDMEDLLNDMSDEELEAIL